MNPKESPRPYRTGALTTADAMPLYPVIIAVPDTIAALKGKKRNLRLSALARRAVVLSAAKSGLALTHLKKNGHGAPLPCGPVYWSLSHKTTYVAGVTAPGPIGIDIERVRSISSGLFEKVTDSGERELAGPQEKDFFFRVWTAKEAVLKAAGIGLRHMNRCRLQAVLDPNHLQLLYQERSWLVEHHFFDDHVVAITSLGQSIRWQIA